MSNNLNTQILVDTRSKTVIKFTGELDGSGQEIANTKIVGKSLFGALAVDTNNAILVTDAGAVPRTTYGYTITRLIYDINIPSGYLSIKWDGTTPAIICDAHGVNDINQNSQLGVIQNNALTPNGNVTFTTVGAVANCSYTVLIELHKNGNDYDQGQRASPIDFNFGKYAIKP